MTAEIEEKKEDGSMSDARRFVSRRTFVGLGLGALGILMGACERATSAPTTAPTVTPEATDVAGVSPTAPPTATRTPAPPSATPSPTPSPSPTCSPLPLTDTPTARPATLTSPPPTYTPVPATATSPPLPTATATPPLSRAALVARWPVAETSRVVAVRHGGAWAGNAPDPTIVLQMLDDGLRTLAGTGDALTVWRTLFDPGERVLLKVNCIAYGGPTQPAVTYAVAQRLQDAGLRAENILIFDRTDHELEASGYSLNDGGPGVQCHGSRGEGSEVVLSQARVRFYQEIDTCDAIVNLPTPKQHGGAGISVALKNHYGSVNRPGKLHGDWCDPAIAELNAQSNIQSKTRLVVGAALNVSPRDWNRPVREHALLLSFDPVALDTVARDILVRRRQAVGLDTGYLIEGARHLRTAQGLKLGATAPELIELKEVMLG
jgi:uncharacterized protein (DUF362 family)